MTKSFIWVIFSFLAIFLLASGSSASSRSNSVDITGQDTDSIPLIGSSMAFRLAGGQQSFPHDNFPIPRAKGYGESNTNQTFPLRHFVTPEDEVIMGLAAQTNGVEEAYQVAVQWTYVSEQRLNNVAEKWLTPNEFLIGTPYYPGNPLTGNVVSDCEEQAHTLVSLIRAQGIRPEAVRVVIGEVGFDGKVTGHAWVELLADGDWLVLEPNSGPYWDDKTEKVVRRQGRSFNYYQSHTYPVLQVHAYFNDSYYLDPRDGSGNAPASWLNPTHRN